jgi:5'-3' exonuclease
MHLALRLIRLVPARHVMYASSSHKQAPGEAEAELAYLNSIGEIDAVLSDDVDNFLFGATTVIRK